MKHLIPCEELKQHIGDGRYEVLACKYDDGSFAKNSDHIIRLGIGADIVFIFPCEGCVDSLRAVFSTEALETIAGAIKHKEPPVKYVGTFCYRGLVFDVVEGYLLASGEMMDKTKNAIDSHLDKGEPLSLIGLVLREKGEES